MPSRVAICSSTSQMCVLTQHPQQPGAHSQKWTLEWLKMSACMLRLWKHCGDSTMPTSSPPSNSGSVFR
jgi:hypothetical protein